MSKFNKGKQHIASGTGPIKVSSTDLTTATYEGSSAYERDAKSELFLLAVTNMVSEKTFYESAQDRDSRFSRLVREVAISDCDWLTRFITWLRITANMRSAAIVMACEAVHERLAKNMYGNNRHIISYACARGDEPGELLAYWTSKFGCNLPMSVKRGLADAATRLYTEYSMLKYDTSSHGVRFADVIMLSHPKAICKSQNDLFKYILDRHYNPTSCAIPTSLEMITTNTLVRTLVKNDPTILLNNELLFSAGITWEYALSQCGSKIDKRELWSALIPTMGIMALARNLRNFDEVEISDEDAQYVINKFSDPKQVMKSRMFPFRWLTAYREALSLRWGYGLEKALNSSIYNIPALTGRTLVLIDTSGSMTWTGISQYSTTSPIDIAALFGIAIAIKNSKTDLVGFANRSFTHKIKPGTSILREIESFEQRVGEVGHGTYIARALKENYASHDRVIILSDQQSMDASVSAVVPANVKMYGFNLLGYASACAAWGAPNRIELGGFSDAMFEMIPLIEAGHNCNWPF